MMSEEPVHSSTGSYLPFTVCVEGNIGSGKTTFLNRCARNSKMEVLCEPIEAWQDVGGVNLLEKLYADPVTWGMTFQTYVTLTMLQTHVRSNGAAVKVMERLIFSARHCFVESMRMEGTLNQGMYHVLQEWYDFIDEYHQVRADLIVYLRTTPAVAYQRLRERGRNEEGGVTLHYLTRLHELHETWIENERAHRSATIIVIDANKQLADLASDYEECVASILSAVG